MEHGNSLLTTKLREFVTEGDHSHRTSADVSQKRSAIRRRLRDALLDCERLLDNPQEAQLDRILNAETDNVSERDVFDLRSGMSSVVGLLWLLCRRDDRTANYEAVASTGVEAGFLADGFDATAFVSVDTIKADPINEVVERAREKDPTDFREMRNYELDALVRAGDLTAGEHERVVNARHEAMRAEGLFDHDNGEGDEQEGGDGQ